MNATFATVVGRLITAIDRRTFASGATRVTFRVASTERRYRATEGWGDGETLYVSVTCWRQLGENVLASMNIGDPIIVYGKLYSRSFEAEGRRQSVTEMEGYAVGPDLRWSTAVVTRTKAAAAGTPSENAVAPGPAGARAGAAAVDRWRLGEPDDPELAQDPVESIEKAAGGNPGHRANGMSPGQEPIEAAVGH